MTFAWSGHLKNLQAAPVWVAIAVSWAIVFLEYCFFAAVLLAGAAYLIFSSR